MRSVVIIYKLKRFGWSNTATLLVTLQSQEATQGQISGHISPWVLWWWYSPGSDDVTDNNDISDEQCDDLLPSTHICLSDIHPVSSSKTTDICSHDSKPTNNSWIFLPPNVDRKWIKWPVSASGGGVQRKYGDTPSTILRIHQTNQFYGQYLSSYINIQYSPLNYGLWTRK